MSNKKTLFLSLLVMFLWGSLFPVVKLGYDAFGVRSTGDILLFAGVRFCICGIVISLFEFIGNKNSFIAAKGSVVKILMFGLFAIILHYSFTYSALSLTTGSKTAILKQLGALFYVCFSSLFFKEDKLTAGKLAGAVLGIAGIFAINADGSGFSFGIGDALIIAASFCTVFSNVISKKLPDTLSPITATGLSQVFGGGVLLALGLMLGGELVPGKGAAFVLGYICFASILSYCIWYTVVKSGELSKLFIIKFAEPVFAAVIGAVLLNENIFEFKYLAAFLLIVAGIAVSNKKHREQ